MRIWKLAAAAALTTGLLAAAPAQADWIATWDRAAACAAGHRRPLRRGILRQRHAGQVLRVSEGGERLRIRFSNRYGAAPLAIGAARVVRVDDAGREIAGSSRVLTFGGEAGAVIPRGAPFVSDGGPAECSQPVAAQGGVLPAESHRALHLPSHRRRRTRCFSAGQFRGQVVHAGFQSGFPRVSQRGGDRLTESGRHHCRLRRLDHRWRGFNPAAPIAAGRTSSPTGCRPPACTGRWPMRRSAATACSAPAWASRPSRVSTKMC